jgi:hypothetical protein
VLRQGDRLVVLADNGEHTDSMSTKYWGMCVAPCCRACGTVAEAELATHAGKSAREQRGYFTNSEYIGDYPCRWELCTSGR